MENPCGVGFALRHIITKVELVNGTTYETIPFPEGAVFTLEALTVMFHVAKQTLYNELSEKRARFEPPVYRRHGFRRSQRLLSQRDVDTLRALFRVKRKVISPMRPTP